MTRAFSCSVGRRTSVRSWTPLLILPLAALGLAGCESGSNILANGNSTTPETQLAQPAAPAQTQTAKIQIAPVIGSPETVAADLQTQLSAAIERNRITVATGPNASGEFIARGYVVAARERNGSRISYIWDLTDKTDKRVHRITGEEFAAGTGKDPWAAVTPQVVQKIADKAASQIATWLGGNQTSIPIASNTTPVSTGTTPQAAGNASPVALAPSTPVAATPAVATSPSTPATPAALTTAANTPATAAAPSTTGPTTGSIQASGPVTAMVPTVTGAPGDGSTALAGAIQRELAKSGVTLASTATSNTYRVEGKVEMGAGKDGKQPIKIDWSVIDPAGKKLGTVSQKNEIPQGSLDGAWGRTADAAAQAATQGIIKLLPQAKATN